MRLPYLTFGIIFMILTASEVGADPAGRLYEDKGSHLFYSSGEAPFSSEKIGNSQYQGRTEYSIDGDSYRAFEGSIRLKEEGPHRIRFRALDPQGNWSVVQRFDLVTDLTPPQSFREWEGKFFEDGDLFVRSDTKLRLYSQDGGAGVAALDWELDGVAQEKFSERSFSEGKHKVSFRSRDQVGNEEDWKRFEFIVDVQAPATTLSYDGPWYGSKDEIFLGYATEIGLKAEDAGAGVDRIEYRLGQGEINVYRGPIRLSGKGGALRYRSVDRVGNLENWHEVNLVRDSKPPVLLSSLKGKYLPLAGRVFGLPGMSVMIQSKDELSGVKELRCETLDGDSLPLAEGQVVFEKKGPLSIVFRSQDQVGNRSETDVMQLHVDAEGPRTVLYSGDVEASEGEVFSVKGADSIKFRSEDEGVGVDRIEFSFDGKKFFPVPKSQELHPGEWTESSRVVYFRGIDRLGNVEPTRKVQVEIAKATVHAQLFVESQKLSEKPYFELIKKGEGESQP